MAKWYPKEFSKLTKISVRTLHHYDDIGLLKPSIRLQNGYRLYSEADLSKLQQIVSLKFFGFKLSQIAHFLSNDCNSYVEQLHAQKRCLQKQIESLTEATKVLDETIDSLVKKLEIDWKITIKLIEVYTMTQELEQTWAGKIFSKDQLKDFAELNTRYSEEEKKNYENKWAELIQKTIQHLDHSPLSNIGKKLAKEWMDHVNSVYGKENAILRTTIGRITKKERFPILLFRKT
ncbi:MAG: MerR family transcriptional regulator [Sphingobacteriia bacterium]|nr:MerR family transcriptional regulator [Sphingobacteriia bacterium]